MIRYPGSKDKIADRIMRHFPHEVMDELFQSRRLEYREPFFGGGAIGWDVIAGLPRSCSAWLNDKDYGMACLWKSVHQNPGELIDMVRSFKPTVDAFYKFKEEDSRTDLDPVRTGFQKLALHQISFSGLGAKAGGPIGGRKQRSEFNVSCRWNATRHALRIKERNAILRRLASVTITSGDFSKLIDGAMPHVFIYCDPPYYEKGAQLYKHSMTDDDHRRLAACLHGCKAQWVLSYDDHQFIRELYSWADISEFELTYSIAESGPFRRKNHEIIIRPRRDRRGEA